jgi:hypothetical protein
MGCDLSAQIPSASGLSPPAPSSARSLNRSGSRRPRPAFQQGHSSAAGAVAPVHRHLACRVRQPGLVSSRESQRPASGAGTAAMDEADQSTRRTIACRALRSRGSSTSRWHRAPLWLCTTLYRRTGRTDPLLARRRATADARLRQHLPSCERVAGKSAEPDAALLLRPERPAMSTPAVPFVAKRKPAEFRSVDRPSVSWRAAVQLTPGRSRVAA